MIRLTRAGALFLGALVLLYFASLTSQSPLLLLLIGIVGGCYLVNLAVARRMVRHLEIQAPHTVHLPEGRRLPQPWRIINRSAQPAALVRVEAAAGAGFGVSRLAGHAETSVVPDLIFWRRGVYPYAEVTVSSTYPFGLLKVSRRLSLAGEVVVYPALFEVPSPRAAGFDAVVGGKFKGRRRAAAGAEFAGVRPIQPGDSLKQIHWKSSSKGLGLMVKTFDEELSGRVAVVMDCGHSGDPKAFDDCARAAGSLIFAALDAGHQVEWIDVAHRQPLPISPFSDGQELLDRLARITAVAGSLTGEALLECAERVARKSALCLVLTVCQADTLKAIDLLRERKRVVSLYLPETAARSADAIGRPALVYDERGLKEPA
jgi:uncharacterized protein (DUF58 family)